MRLRGLLFRKAQSTRTAKFDPRTLSRKCSRKWPRECTRRCPRKCPRRLRLVLCKTHQRIPTKTPTRVLTGKFLVLTGNFPVLTKMYTKVGSVNFHMSYFHMFCFLANSFGTLGAPPRGTFSGLLSDSSGVPGPKGPRPCAAGHWVLFRPAFLSVRDS